MPPSLPLNKTSFRFFRLARSRNVAARSQCCRIVNGQPIQTYRSATSLTRIQKMSLFSQVPVAAPDPILGTAVAFKLDADPAKVNLGIGAYRTDEGRPYLFPVVRKVEAEILSDASLDKEYLPIDGLADLKPLTQALLFGADSGALKEGRIASCQSISGTGALRVAGDFIKHFTPKCKFAYLSKPTWTNHHNIFGPGAGLEIREYPYWDPVTKRVNYDGMIKALEEAPLNSAVVLHACAHNPTGVDLSETEWEGVLGVCSHRQLLPIIDSAYQGFASGDLVRDAFAIRLFADRFKGASIITQSFAKNMGLYGERIGMMHAVCSTPEEAEAVLSQLKIVARRMYSSPPIHGARIVARVLGHEGYRRQWEAELQAVSERIKKTRELLRSGLEQKGTPGTWNHITEQIGMFSYTGLTADQCELLISKWHIYLLKNGRISMAGVNSDNVDYIVRAIDDIIRQAPS